ncbi:MAG TPA: alpha/beta hydrolase, partial [Pseudomonas sp.]|nr:alpha/beta hydrolase [Pseudomonas sp.]
MATIQVEERFIDNGNGHVLSSCWYQPDQEPAGVVLIAPAMGVPQRFYTDFANWLADRGYLAVTFDYLGMGRSRRMPLRQLKVDILDWGRHDCSAVLAAA